MVKNPASKPDETAAVAGAGTPSTNAKAVAVAASADVAPAVNEPKKIDLTKPPIKDAIAQGKALIKEGKSKADAARAMYAVIKDEPKEVIIAAFIAGATLTAAGAQTYWYNCKRKASKAG